MELLIVRHAIAEERDPAKWPDDRGRPLTREGIRKFRSVGRVLGGLAKTPDKMLSSPLARAWQTAQILETECTWPEPEEFAALEPERRPAETITGVKKLAGAERVVLVGHEPHLHQLLSLLLAGSAEAITLQMKKGGAALVVFDGPPKAGGGNLLWLASPRVLLADEK